MQVWINGDDAKNVEAVAKALDRSMKEHKSAELKAFFIFVVDKAATKETEQKLSDLAKSAALEGVMLTYLPKDSQYVKLYKFNTDPEVKNTVIAYKGKRVTAKMVNFKADDKGLAELTTSVKSITQ